MGLHEVRMRRRDQGHEPPDELKRGAVVVLRTDLELRGVAEVVLTARATPASSGDRRRSTRSDPHGALPPPGVPRHELGHLFVSFRRLGDEASPTTLGTGLGLGVVRRLAASLGGSVRAEPADWGWPARVPAPARPATAS
jgi:hypothetical protein